MAEPNFCQKTQALPWSFATILFFVALLPATSQEQQSDNFDARRVIAEFSRSWDESAWENEVRTTPEKYMRSADNADWQLRMRTMQNLVQHSEESVGPLLEALDSDNLPVRILAAQALGFLESDKALSKLLDVAKSDEHPAVRLYAIDSYGMLGGNAAQLEPLSQTEKNRDARMHIKYAIQRDGKGLRQEVRESLANWDSGTMATARIGEAAPEFTLDAANGDKVSLSDFRGKSAVVLIFIYGDT